MIFKCIKDMIQTHVFLEWLFSLDWHFGGFKLKNEAWWDVYFLMLIFRKIFILADKISRFASFWLPIQNLNSVALVELPHLNCEYVFMCLSANFCQNASALRLFAHFKNDVICISKIFMGTRNTQVLFHTGNIISWISFIFSLRNWCNLQFIRSISF